MTTNSTRRRVLDRLERTPTSGAAIARELGISRTAVWKHVDALRADGFEIEGTAKGYRLLDVPEYGGLSIQYELDAPYTIEYHDRIESTNERGRAVAERGDTDAVVIADRQTAGRGRRGRRWIGPSGGIYMSIVCRPPIAPMEAPVLTLAGAVATVRALDDIGIDAGIKWPNDILVHDRKIAGILTEMRGEADRVDWVVLGIGLNANVPAAALPPTATSIEALAGPCDRRTVVRSILSEFDACIDDPAGVLEAAKATSLTLGRRVSVETEGGTIIGTAVDLERPGSLVVETDGSLERIHAGDCRHLRPR